MCSFTFGQHPAVKASMAHTPVYFRETMHSPLDRLPILPQELNILIVKSKNATHNNDGLARHPEFQAKHQRVLDNLHALKRFHPGYRQITVNQAALQALSEDNSVHHLLRSVEVDEELEMEVDLKSLATEADGEMENDISITEAGVPFVGAADGEETAVRGGLEQVLAKNAQVTMGLDRDLKVLTVPGYNLTPLYEHDQDERHLVAAFPFLYPQGKADLHQAGQEKVNEGEDFKHMMRYKDKRFARHPCFRQAIECNVTDCADTMRSIAYCAGGQDVFLLFLPSAGMKRKRQ